MSTRAKKIASARWFFIVIALIVLFLTWKVIQPLVLTLVSAAVLAIVLTPIERRLRARIGRPMISSILTVAFAFVVVIVPLFIIVLVLIDQVQGLLQYAQSNPDFFNGFDIRSFELFQVLPVPAQEWILAIDPVQVGEAAGRWAVVNLQSRVSDVVRIILNAAVFFVALYYFLHDRREIREELHVLSPLKDQTDTEISHRIVSTIRNVVLGAVIVAFIQAIFATIGLAIFGVPGAMIWGSLAIVAAQIPMLGIGLIMAPAIAYLAIIGNTGAAIGLAIWAVVVVGFIDNIISPFIVQGRTKMHALLILVSIIGGLQLVGPTGFIVGPTILAALLVVIDLYKSGILEVK